MAETISEHSRNDENYSAYMPGREAAERKRPATAGRMSFLPGRFVRNAFIAILAVWFFTWLILYFTGYNESINPAALTFEGAMTQLYLIFGLFVLVAIIFLWRVSRR